LRQLADDASDARIDGIFPNVHYNRIRTYEVVTQAQEPPKELLISFCEDDEGEGPARKKRKGAFVKELFMRTLLRKTRAKRRGEVETRGDQWDRLRVGFRVANQDEQDERSSVQEQVTDPTWANEALRRIHGGDNMAEGQGEAIDDEELPPDEGAEKAEQDAEEDDD